MNVVIYARYSDSKQREESIEGQLKICTEFAEKHGYIIIGEYIDRAFSAKTDDRPQFQRMIQDSNKKYFQGVIVYQLDRFARNRYDSAHYKNVLKKNGVTVISAREAITDDANGILLEAMLEGMAEYYSAELSQKVVRGMNINAEKCLSNGGTTPLGYKIVDRHYVINEDTAPIVKEIFTKYASGWTAKAICDSLNERQVKTARGASFNKSSLNTILNNRKYLGIYIYNGQEIVGGMPQIIDNDLFNKVAEKMAENKKSPARSRAKAQYILSGKLYCGYCKEKMIGHSSNQISKKGVIFNYYKCKNSGGGRPCQKKMVKKDYIEDVIVKECRKLLTPKSIRRIAREVMKITLTMKDSTEIKRLESLKEKIQIEKSNLMIALRECSDKSVREQIFEELGKISAEIAEIDREYEKEKSRHYIVTEEQVVTHLSNLAKGDINDKAYRATLIKLFVNKIFLYDDKFTIVFNTGDEEVTITDELLDKLEETFSDEKFCLLNSVVHHKTESIFRRKVLFVLS